MSRETRLYRQLITYWAPLPGDDGYGNVLLAPPVTFQGHWSDKEQTFLSPRGEQIVSRAEVHYPADMTIIPDGWLVRGVQTAADPRTVPGAIIVRKTSEIPDIRNLETIKIAAV